MQLHKYLLLLLFGIGGFGTAFYNYFTRFDYLNQDYNTITGVVENVYYIKTTKKAIRDGSILINEYGKENPFIIRSEVKEYLSDSIYNLVEWPMLDTIESPKLSHFLPEGHGRNKPASRLNSWTFRYEKDTFLEYSLTGKEILKVKVARSSSLIVVYSLNVDGEKMRFKPSLREVRNESESEKSSMIDYFDGLLNKGDTVSMVYRKNSIDRDVNDFNDQFNLKSFGISALCYDVHRIINQNGRVLYTFPFNPEYEEKIFNMWLYTIFTSILTFIIFLSIVFGWKAA